MSKTTEARFYTTDPPEVASSRPFSAEGPTIEKVHRFIEAKGQRAGKHHEIYLSDIRKADPAKEHNHFMRLIPVAPSEGALL